MCGAWRDGSAAHGVVFDDEPSGSRGAFGAVGRGAFGSGKIMPRCVPGRRSVAIFRRGAFPGRQPWQFFRLMRSRRGLGREKRRLVATFRCHVSEMSWSWQDIRVMYPKSPANSRLGIHCAKILPRRGPFRCTRPSNHARRAYLAMNRRRHTRPAQKRSSEAVGASTPSRLPCL